jgi:murein L,D-transpeptidase YcbB/YkuD
VNGHGHAQTFSVHQQKNAHLHTFKEDPMARIYQNPVSAARSLILAGLAVSAFALATPAQALVTAFKQAVAEQSSETEALAQFYRARDFEPIWMGEGAADRRAAFLWALDTAPDHGLPVSRYIADDIRAAFAAADSPRARGLLEVRLSEMFLAYASDVSSGMLDPKSIDAGMVLTKPTRDPLATITGFATGDPRAYVKDLWPTSPMYLRLLREKLRLEHLRAHGGWGPAVPAGALKQGSSGLPVIALRNRLIRMGYLGRSAVRDYDASLAAAVRSFQIDHGLAADGDAGPATMTALNVSIEDRLGQILVGLERQRWMNKPLEKRHILVNLSEFHAYVVDDGKVTFDTVVVVGANSGDRRTPEFSDEMTHMIVNPTWHVPRSIATKEYLPALQRGGANHLRLFRGGREVSRQGIDFSQYSARTFPYELKQPPSNSNALGLVKFMFPNRWNIYLHDTPSKSLFERDVRAFSHGCVRVERPFDLAYHLLTPQTSDPKGVFQSVLATKRETRVDLETPIGIHLVYWTAWVTPTGRVNYRDDIYGRDAGVLRALEAAGVGLRALDS